MKKLLLASAVSLLAASASANEGTFYVRGDVGASMLPKQTTTVTPTTGVKYKSKLKSATHFVGSIGVGTYLMDNVRTELNLTNHFNASQKVKSNADLRVKSTILGLTLKGLVDVYDYGMGKVFVGAGIGAAQSSAKISIASGETPSDFKGKKNTNFTYLATVGTGFDVSEGVMLDLAYSFNDFGKPANNKDLKTNYKLRTHDLTAGVRFEL